MTVFDRKIELPALGLNSAFIMILLLNCHSEDIRDIPWPVQTLSPPSAPDNIAALTSISRVRLEMQTAQEPLLPSRHGTAMTPAVHRN